MAEELSEKPPEPISIDSLFSLINELLSLVDAPVKFKNWEFYKERILYSYEEEELETELIPVSTFAELRPGSRIFWRGWLVIDKIEVETVTVFNINRMGETKIETIRSRKAKGLSPEDSRNKRVVRRHWRTVERIAPIVIPLIERIIMFYL